MIPYADFQKVELKIAKIVAAERVIGSDTLLRLEVDLGSARRQIVAGIGKTHAPETLIGLEIAMVVNLEPRTLRGLESQGMLLAADAPDGPVILVPEKEVLPGTSIK